MRGSSFGDSRSYPDPSPIGGRETNASDHLRRWGGGNKGGVKLR